MLLKARTINGKADICIAITGKKDYMFDLIFEKVSDLSFEFTSVLKKYEKRIFFTRPCEENDLYDEIQEDLIAITQSCEDDLIRYCIDLKNNIKLIS